MNKDLSPDDKPKRRILTLNPERAGKFRDPERLHLHDRHSPFARRAIQIQRKGKTYERR